MKALIIFSGALTGLMMILVGTLTPTAMFVPSINSSPEILSLKTSWQIPSLLLCAMVCGPESAFAASIAYLTIGLFYLPIFNGGGSIGYLLTPDFGFLVGFLPAALITGKLAAKTKKNNLIGLTLSAIYGLAIIHSTGILNLMIGSISSRWPEDFSELFLSYSLSPIFSQVLVCPAIAILAIILNKFLRSK